MILYTTHSLYVSQRVLESAFNGFAVITLHMLPTGATYIPLFAWRHDKISFACARIYRKPKQILSVTWYYQFVVNESIHRICIAPSAILHLIFNFEIVYEW